MEPKFDVLEWLQKQDGGLGDVFISNGCYAKWSRGRDPLAIPISNFVLKAVAKIEQGSQWWFECIAVNKEGIIKEDILLSRDDFGSPSGFKRVLSSDCRLEYYGDSKDITRIQGLLTNQKPRIKEGTDTLGVHKLNGRWVYVEGNQVIDHDGVVDDIVFTKKNLNQDDVPTLLQQEEISYPDLKAIAENLNKFNESAIVYPLLGWVGSCFVKERLAYKVNKKHSILLVQGEPGSGKTETISRIVKRIFCSHRPISNIADVTKFTLALNGSQSNFIPCFYDEWKESVMTKAKKKDLDSVILTAFNQTNLLRGTADQTVNAYGFTSPLAIMGEMTIESPSIKHRIIELFFNYKGRSGKDTFFHNLCQLPLGSFGKSLMLHSLSISDERLSSVFDEQRKLLDVSLKDRFSENATMARVGLWLMIDYFKANWVATDDYAEGYTCIDNVIKEALLAAKMTNVEKIIYDLSVMSNTRNCSGNWLNVGTHYEIRDGILYIRIAEAYSAYLRYAKTNEVTAEIINKSSFLQQLATRPYFVGKKTVRISNIPCNGICINLKAIPEYAEVSFAA